MSNTSDADDSSGSEIISAHERRRVLSSGSEEPLVWDVRDIVHSTYTSPEASFCSLSDKLTAAGDQENDFTARSAIKSYVAQDDKREGG